MGYCICTWNFIICSWPGALHLHLRNFIICSQGTLYYAYNVFYVFDSMSTTHWCNTSKTWSNTVYVFLFKLKRAPFGDINLSNFRRRIKDSSPVRIRPHIRNATTTIHSQNQLLHTFRNPIPISVSAENSSSKGDWSWICQYFTSIAHLTDKSLHLFVYTSTPSRYFLKSVKREFSCPEDQNGPHPENKKNKHVKLPPITIILKKKKNRNNDPIKKYVNNCRFLSQRCNPSA